MLELIHPPIQNCVTCKAGGVKIAFLPKTVVSCCFEGFDAI